MTQPWSTQPHRPGKTEESLISIYSFGAERASLSYTDPARSAPPCLGELRLELSYRLSTPTLDFSGDAALVDTDASHGLFI